MTEDKKPIILFVINPISGDEDKTDFKGKAQKHQLSKKYNVEFFYTTGEDDENKLSESVKQLDPEICVAVGGDGTINLVASTIANTNIKLGIIPGGSANGMAYELGIAKNITKAMDLLVSPKTKRTDVLKINDSHICLHLSDLGMNARIVRRFEEDDMRGLLGYAKQFFREWDISKKFKCQVNLKNGKNLKENAVMLVIANASYFGTGVNINPLGKLDDGKLDVIVIKPYPYWYIFKFIAASVIGKLHQQEYVKVISAEEVNITVTPPQDLQIDGEVFHEQTDIKATVLKHAIEVIVP